MSDLGVNGFVQQVGTTSEQAVAVPSNIHIAGWYNQAALPGEPGLSIIDGHVSGRYSDGIFKELRSANAGSRFEIEYGDRTTKTFEIIDVIQLPEAESAAALFNKRPEIESQLNLITCGGEFDSSTQQYEERVLVISKLVS
jgi:sortase (surface protein transpeptidase)